MREWNELFTGLADGGAVATAEAAEASDREGGWFSRFRDNLSKSRKAFTDQVVATTLVDPADPDTWERIEEGLIAADVGVKSTVAIVEQLESRAAAGRIGTGQELARELRDIASDLMSNSVDATIDLRHKPAVLVVVGVNGTGKTTTIGKLAHRLRGFGLNVVVGAADTFRAAATEQLAVWAERSGATFVTGKEGSDPAAVAFEAVKRGVDDNADVVIVDTAGRLHTKGNLMRELEKVHRVVGNVLEGAPHETLIVIDATTGQNGMRQATEFANTVPVDGVVLTKLDGSAKGGIAVAIANELDIPIKLVGIGESLEDLRPFTAGEYLDALFPDDVLG